MKNAKNKYDDHGMAPDDDEKTWGKKLNSKGTLEFHTVGATVVTVWQPCLGARSYAWCSAVCCAAGTVCVA